jgi:hypothetical protein
MLTLLPSASIAGKRERGRNQSSSKFGHDSPGLWTDARLLVGRGGSTVSSVCLCIAACFSPMVIGRFDVRHGYKRLEGLKAAIARLFGTAAF